MRSVDGGGRHLNVNLELRDAVIMNTLKKGQPRKPQAGGESMPAASRAAGTETERRKNNEAHVARVCSSNEERPHVCENESLHTTSTKISLMVPTETKLTSAEQSLKQHLDLLLMWFQP